MDNHKKTENFLQSFSRKPAPQGLRERILHSVYQEKKTSKLMTSGLWILLVVCSVLTVVSLFLDEKTTRIQQRRILSLINLSTVSDNSNRYDKACNIAEFIDEPSDSELASWIRRRYEFRKKTKMIHSDYESFETLKEEFNGS